MSDRSRCMDCLGPATVQVVSLEGAPIMALCDEDFEARQKFGAKIRVMLDDACKWLAEQAEPGFAGDLSAFKPAGFSGAVDQVRR